MYKKLLIVLGSMSIFLMAYSFCLLYVFNIKNEYVINYNINIALEALRYNKGSGQLTNHSSGRNIEKLMLDRYMLLYLVYPALASHSSIVSIANNKVIDIKSDSPYKECIKQNILQCENILFVDELSGVKFFLVVDTIALMQHPALNNLPMMRYKKLLTIEDIFNIVNFKEFLYVVIMGFMISLIMDSKSCLKNNRFASNKSLKHGNLRLYSWEEPLLSCCSISIRKGLQKIHIKTLDNVDIMSYINNKAFVDLQIILIKILKIIPPELKVFINFTLDNNVRCEINLNKPMWMNGSVSQQISQEIVDVCKYKKKVNKRIESLSNFNGMYFSNIVLREIKLSV